MVRKFVACIVAVDARSTQNRVITLAIKGRDNRVRGARGFVVDKPDARHLTIETQNYLRRQAIRLRKQGKRVCDKLIGIVFVLTIF